MKTKTAYFFQVITCFAAGLIIGATPIGNPIPVLIAFGTMICVLYGTSKPFATMIEQEERKHT